MDVKVLAGDNQEIDISTSADDESDETGLETPNKDDITKAMGDEDEYMTSYDEGGFFTASEDDDVFAEDDEDDDDIILDDDIDDDEELDDSDVSDDDLDF